MPRIPIITPSGGAVVANASRVYGVDAAGTLIAQQGLNTLASSLSNIATRITRQEEDIEFSAVRGSYDPDLQRIRKNVLVDPNIDNPFLSFNEQAQELQKTYLDNIKSPNVRTAFSKYISATYPQVQSDALDDALKLQNQKNIAGLHTLGDTLSTEAATGTPEVRDRAISEYNEQIDRAEKYGTINPIVAADAKKKFRIDTMTKNMNAMAHTDPYKLFELSNKGAYNEVDENIRLKTLEFARASIEQDEKKELARFKEAQLANYKYYGTLANQGAIPESELEMMIAGEHPYVRDPAEVASLVHRNSNPLIGPSTAVEAIMLDFHAMSMASPEKVLEATAKARAQLDHYRKTMTKRDPALDPAYDKLQQAERMMSAAERSTRSEARAERGEVRAERSAARAEESAARAEATANETAIMKEIKIATELYKTTAKPVMPGMMGKFQKAKEIVDLNEIAGLVRNGMKAKDAVDLISKKRKEEAPKGNSRVQELVPR